MINFEQHPVGKSIFLHMYTGVAVILFRIFVTPFTLEFGFPPVFAGILAFILVSIPFQLGYMLYRGKKRNGLFSLRGIVLYRQPISFRQYIVFPFLLVLFILIVALLTEPVSILLADSVFSWLPSWLLNPEPLLYTSSYAMLGMVFLLVLLVDGIVNPIVEEAYWRGYLMPRLSRFGVWAPIMNGFLFGLQHFWQPFNYPSIFLFTLLLAYVVWRKKNIYISIIAHCTVNIISALLTFRFLLT